MKMMRVISAVFLLGFLITCAGSLALNSVVILPATVSISPGATQQFEALGFFNDGSNHDITTQVTWTSSDTTVATIDSTGLATGSSLGTTTIQAISGTPGSYPAGNTGTAVLVVVPAIIVITGNAVISAGTTENLTATGTDANGTPIADITTKVAWSSSNTSVVTVDSSGLVAAHQGGTVTITAVLGTVSGTFSLTVD